MNKKEAQKFNDLLLKQKALIEDELKGVAKRNPGAEEDWESKFPKFEQENFDMEEAADEVEEFINRLPLEKALEERLQETENAIERIKQGTYGKCENCEKVIPTKRLEAIPETRICLNCEENKKKVN